MAFALALAASILPDLLLDVPHIQAVKIAVLLAASILLLCVKKLRSLWKLSASLLVIDASFLLTAAVRGAGWWGGLFAGAGFFGDITGAVTVKMIGIAPVAAALLLLTGSPEKALLTPGTLSAKATAIRWLGIPEGKIRWGSLAPVSGLLIMSGTALLAVVTTTGFRMPGGVGRLLSNLPLILILALANSFCEGLVFRSAVMAPVRDAFPKPFTLLMTALFFGIAHLQGIPGGPLGAVMSGVLGWYMARSMLETGGFASAWIIHFMQDIAIFSTLALLG